MQHEALESFALQHIQALLVFAGSERGGDQRLRFAARKQRGAVGAGQDANFGTDGAHLIERALVRPLPLLQHIIAEQSLFHFVNKVRHQLALGHIVLGIACHQRFAQFGNLAMAFQLDVLGSIHGLVERFLDLAADFLVERFIARRRGELALLQAQLFKELFLRRNNPANLAVRVLNRLNDASLRKLL